MNKFATSFVEEATKWLNNHTQLKHQERVLLEHRIKGLKDGSITLSGPDTVIEFLSRLDGHYP